MKKLYRSSKDKVLMGVIGGIGEYFDVDPVLLRLLFVLFLVLTGFLPGVLLYFVAAVIMPVRP